MKCKQCNTNVRSLHAGYCSPCYRSNSYPIEAFSDEEIVKEIARRIRKGSIKTDWESMYGDSEGCGSLYTGEWKKEKVMISLYDGKITKDESK